MCALLLQEYFSGHASLHGKPEEVDRNQILYQLAKCVEFMHARNLVHGALTPDSLMWFSPEKKWKLIGFGNWARDKEGMHVTYDLRHAAPELVLADLGRVSLHANVFLHSLNRTPLLKIGGTPQDTLVKRMKTIFASILQKSARK